MKYETIINRIIIVYFLSNLFRIKFLNKINNKSDSILRFWLIDVRLIFVEYVFQNKKDVSCETSFMFNKLTEYC